MYDCHALYIKSKKYNLRKMPYGICRARGFHKLSDTGSFICKLKEVGGQHWDHFPSAVQPERAQQSVRSATLSPSTKLFSKCTISTFASLRCKILEFITNSNITTPPPPPCTFLPRRGGLLHIH